MVNKLCLHYGPYVASIEEEAFHDFPGPEALAAEGVEQHLRELGFGYRAKYIAETAGCVAQVLGERWLLGLRNPGVPALMGVPAGIKKEGGSVKKEEEGAEEKADSKMDLDDEVGPPTYKKAHEALLTLPGVGPKVSDCVCLMGLGWGESVPIDTHVWQIAQRDYNFGGSAKTKTLNKAMYEAVGDHFRKTWGPQAGWAQSVLFTANLKSFAKQAAGVKKKEAVKTEEESEEVTAPTTVEAVTKPTGKRKGVVVKVEENEEMVATTSVAKSRKRKTVAAAEVIPKAEPTDAAVQMTTTTRTLRSSKRIKSQV